MKKNSCYWYCPKCKEELDGCHVTYQELCEYCGTAVLSVPESISQETIKEIIKAKAEGRLVKRGKWIYEHEWKCSSCGWAQSHDFNTIPNDILKYCPNCGAKMSKGAAEKAIGGKEDA